MLAIRAKTKKLKLVSLFMLISTVVFGLCGIAQAAEETLYPNAIGDLSQHGVTLNGIPTPPNPPGGPSNENWSYIAETPNDGDASTIYGSGATEKYDLYNIPSPSIIDDNDTINSITVHLMSKDNNFGTSQVAPYIKESGTSTPGTLQATTTSFVDYSQTWLTKPSDSGSWTYNDIVSLQIGIYSKGTNAMPPSYEITTQVYVVVDYTVVPNIGPLDHFHLVVASPQTNGVAFTGTNTLTAHDADSNVITDFDASTNNVTLTSSPADGTISGLGSGVNAVLNQAGDFSNGVANLTSLGMKFTGTSGDHTFTATSADNKTGTSGTVTINAGTATKLGMKTQPGGGTAAIAWETQPAVYIQDASGNTVTTDSTTTVTATIGTNPNSGTLAGTTTVTAASGVATFDDLSINKFGTGYTLSFASTPVLTGVTSSAFVINAAAGSCGDTDGDGVQESVCACGNTVVGAAGYVYTLTGSLTCTGHGLVVGADNITIDGGNYTIDGDIVGADYGINNSGGYDGITIQDFNITDFNKGIYLSNSNSSIISNNTLTLTQNVFVSTAGIDLSYSDSNDLNYNTVYGYTSSIALSYSDSNDIDHNTVSISQGGAFTLSVSTLNNFTNNTISSTYTALSLSASSNSNTFDHNTFNSNSYGIKFSTSTSNIFTNNTFWHNENNFNANSGNTWENNTFLHSLNNEMLTFSTASYVKNHDDNISFTLTTNNIDGTSCNSCASSISVSVSPSESSLALDTPVNNQITGTFTVTRSGVYNLITIVTDGNNNVAKRNYPFYVDVDGSKTTRYYFRGTDPTHGQGRSAVNSDGKSFLFTAPTESEEGQCLVWVKVSPDELPEFPLTANISGINVNTWYKGSWSSGQWIAIQRLGIHDGDSYDAYNLISVASTYTWVSTNFSELTWPMSYPYSWYFLTVKIRGGAPYFITFPTDHTAEDASYTDFTYSYTTTPAVKSTSNADINILSATEPVGDTDNATIVLENPTSAVASTNIVLDSYKRPFQDYTTTISSDGTTTVASGNISAGATATLNSVKLDIVPNAGTIAVSSITWNTSGTYSKQWTETGTDVSSASHTIGDLRASGYYTVKVDDAVLDTYLSNSSGQITFTYSGGYSAKTFKVEDLTAPTNVSISSITADSTSQLTIVGTATESETGFHATPYWFSETSGNTGASSSSDYQASTTWTDTGLAINTQYTYKVKAKDVIGNVSDYSSTSSKYTLANAPSSLALTADSVSQITASWSANSNPAGTYFYIENTTAGTNSGWVTDTSWSSASLNCGTTYSFRVKARNGDNTETSWTDTSSVATSNCGGGGLPAGAYSSPSSPSPNSNNPSGGFKISINDGAKNTNNSIVSLTFGVGSDTVKMAISNSPDFSSGTGQIPYQPSYSWNICQEQKECVEGSYTVYAQFYTQYGVSSGIVSDSIIFKEKESIIETIKEIPEKAIEGIKDISEKIKEIIKPKEAEEKPELPPIEETMPKEAPMTMRGEWQLLSMKPVMEFVLAPLPAEIKSLAEKFPELGKTLKKVGITKFTDIEKLKNVKLTLPGLTERVGLPIAKIQPNKFVLPEGVPVAELSPQIKKQIPTEIVFAKTGGQLIDFNIALSVNDKGEPQQEIATISGKPLQLVIKPDNPVKKITGYVVFKSKKVSESQTDEFTGWGLKDLTASLILATPVFAQPQEKPVRIEEKLVLLEFEYTDPDGDGIYTAEIQAPLVEGEYEIITVMDYKNINLGKKEIRLITVVDPEGYIYEKINGKEARIPGATVSLLWLNPETKQYELWQAKEYQQENPQITDVTGKYSFLVPEGSYSLKVEAPGYLVYEGKPFQVTESVGVHTNIELKTKFWWLKVADWKTILLILVAIFLLYNFYRDKIRKN